MLYHKTYTMFETKIPKHNLDVLQVQCKEPSKEIYLFAKEANIGDATRSPTMNADDKRPS